MPKVVTSLPTSQILVLEDDPGVAAALMSVLEEASYRVVVVGTVAEARSMLGRREVDLLVADIMLTDGTAFEVLAIANLHGVPYVLITGNIELAAQLKKKNEVHLIKPFKIEALLREVRRRIGSVYGVSQNRADE